MFVNWQHRNVEPRGTVDGPDLMQYNQADLRTSVYNKEKAFLLCLLFVSADRNIVVIACPPHNIRATLQNF